jgi:hypothetical protein
LNASISRAPLVSARAGFEGRSTWSTVQGASIISARRRPGADQARRHDIRAHQHEDPFPRRPGALDTRPPHGADQLLVDGLGRPPQGQFAQRRQVLRLEEVHRRLARRLGQVDLALFEPLAELGGGDVDHLDLVGVAQHRVRHRLALAHAGDLPDHVDKALQVLDVEGGPDVDAGRDQLLDVLPTLRMARARHVGVGVFVDQQQPRLPRQGGVDVELHQRAAAVIGRLSRQDLEPLQQGLGLGPAVRLDHPD